MREDMIKKYREDINQSVKDYFVLDNKRIQETGRLSV